MPLRGVPRPIQLALVLIALWVVARTVNLLITPGELALPFAKGGYTIATFAACALVLARGLSATGAVRSAWLLVGAGMTLWTLGDLYWTLVLVNQETVPVPSIADAGYLACYPLVFLGLAVLLRHRVRGASPFLWTDGVIAALAVSAVGAAFVVDAITQGLGGDATAAAVNLGYALGDLLMLGIVVTAIALRGWRVDASWACIGAGVAVFFLADSTYLIAIADGTYAFPSLWDMGWTGGFLLLAAGSWVPERARISSRRQGGLREVALPIVFCGVGLAVLAYAALSDLTPVATVLAVCSLIAVMVRLAMTFHENAAVLRASQAEALTDALTGLGNRRALTADLEQVTTTGERHVLVLFDLDGFKHYNDSFGHPAGDSLLARLGANLATAVGEHGTAYRMGGDEFCALLRPGGTEHELLVKGAASALTEQGEGFTVGCSLGVVVLPDESGCAEDALRIADQRMYADKNGGRASAERQTRDVLLRALAERNPELGSHLRDVAELAKTVAGALGLPEAEIDLVGHAAELHDVGKVAIPDAILNKPGPLDASEWEFMHRHTIIGERIIAAAPALHGVAQMVRSSHERHDGEGYPDGLRGDEIPLGARIVAVCDAFDAMTTDRPYSNAMSHHDALSELRRCAGAQFDPAVVEALCTAYERQSFGTGVRAA